MTQQEAIKQFRSIYPETFIKIAEVEAFDDTFIIGAYFPDGKFWFIVRSCMVSPSYDTYEDAKRNII